jgi:hypothetical protein
MSGESGKLFKIKQMDDVDSCYKKWPPRRGQDKNVVLVSDEMSYNALYMKAARIGDEAYFHCYIYLPLSLGELLVGE